MDTNDITAGTYLLVAHSWEEYLSKPGQPFDFRRHKRGAILDLNVEDARRLVSAQAVIPYDPANPTHVVNADGTLSEIPKPDPTNGLVLTQEQLESLGLPLDATSEDVVRALQTTKELMEALNLASQQSAAQAEAIAEAQEAARVAEDRAAAAEAAEAAKSEPVPVVDRPKSDQIKDIVTWVGDDKEKAATALEGEKSTKGDRARPQLVSALEEIITAPGGGS